MKAEPELVSSDLLKKLVCLCSPDAEILEGGGHMVMAVRYPSLLTPSLAMDIRALST